MRRNGINFGSKDQSPERLCRESRFTMRGTLMQTHQRWPRRAVFARWGYLWEFEGVEARSQVNRGIKSVGRFPRLGQKPSVLGKSSNVGKRRIEI